MKNILQAFNPFLPEFRRDPYPIYARIRALEPVHRFAGFKGEQWLLTRHRDVRQLLADPRFVADDLPEQLTVKAAAVRTHLDTLIASIRHWLFFRNPPDHSGVRRLFSREFSPAGVAAYHDRIDAIVGRLLERAAAKERFDLIADVAYPLPTLVMADLQGIPAEATGRLMAWSTELFRVLVPPQSIQAYERMDEIVRAFVGFFAPFVAEARRSPPPGLLGLLTRAEAAGELDEAGVYAFAIMLFSVGQETTENLIGNGVLGLLSHPDQVRALRDDPGLHGEAVDEMLRYDTPVQGVARITREPITLDDVVLPAGARVVFSIGAASRDPDQFAEPDRFVIRREDRSKLPFGAGVHFCLGAHLARLQAECVVRQLFQRFPELRLTGEPLHWRESVLLRGVKALPLSTVRQPAAIEAG